MILIDFTWPCTQPVEEKEPGTKGAFLKGKWDGVVLATQ